MSRKHGQTTYFIEGEGFVGGDEGEMVLGPEDADATTRAFRFIRMFEQLKEKAFRPSIEALTELGRAMDELPNFKNHESLPAGFTYFGQFLDHDITFDNTGAMLTSELSVEELEQGRSPSLDLDSVYGRGPDLETLPIYADDKIHLKIGKTSALNFPAFRGELEATVLPNDLPRGHLDSDPNDAAALRTACIADGRNDENLAVAQTHLAFLKFHNVVVDRLAAEGYSGQQLFDEARRTVVLHYQWIVLHDFLARIVEPQILEAVLKNGRRFYQLKDGEAPGMPIEFSVAAYRFGHSMIRSGYTWNRNFQTEEQGTLEALFQFSGVSGDMRTLPTLPSNWPIDWRRFFELDGAPGVDPAPGFNLTRSIDTALALPLRDLPEMRRNGSEHSLAVRNLLRSRLVGLPSGQDVAEVLGVATLTPAQVAEGRHAELLRKHGFDKRTPLWYYILKEAEVLHDGQRMGPVGSSLLVETFVGLIEGSEISMLSKQYPSWTPTLPGQRPGHFTMADLLLLTNDLNVLGEDRVTTPPVETPSEPTRITHIVQPGDSLRGIAQRFLGDEMRWREIRDANRDTIRDPDLIHPGMELVIVVGNAPTPVPSRRHTVQPGDSLRGIAQQLLGDEMRWREIFNANRNKLGNPDVIQPGVDLEIPSA